LIEQKPLLIDFVDVLYGVAIGAGFARLSVDPRKNWFGLALFVCTLAIVALDWYEYHFEERDVIDKPPQLAYFGLQLLVVGVFNQMFAIAFDSLRGWLFYVGCFCILNSLWNSVVVASEVHEKKTYTAFAVRYTVYAFRYLSLAVVAIPLAVLGNLPVGPLSILFERWLALIGIVALGVATYFLEDRVIKALGASEPVIKAGASAVARRPQLP
jgi:hypothetical protein